MVAQEVNVHEVWSSNLEEEFVKLRAIIDDYPFVAMDTEFPGVVATPMGQFRSKEDFNYQQLLCNVNVLKLIQVGITLMDNEGRLPPDNSIWQFNFHFSVGDDLYSTESIELLRAAGFDFAKHQTDGISMENFGELLTTSGLLVDQHITWITFHSCFDFGYLIKCILLGKLPEDEKEFFSFDIKALIKQPDVAPILKGSLQDVADQLQVARIGIKHQAGSDSLLTAMTFFKLKERFFADNWSDIVAEVGGHMYGLSN